MLKLIWFLSCFVQKLLLKDRVSDISQLRWWVLGFGAQVEVVKPAFLRKEFKEKIKKLVKVYSG